MKILLKIFFFPLKTFLSLIFWISVLFSNDLEIQMKSNQQIEDLEKEFWDEKTPIWVKYGISVLIWISIFF